MRTTIDIADDVLLAAKEIARREKKSLGETISELVRRAFAQHAAALSGGESPGARPPTVSDRLSAYGIHPLPSRGAIVSNDLIERLRDEEGV
jgi:hypothetical protein